MPAAGWRRLPLLCETISMTGAKRDRIRVVIAEDQAMVLGALAALLEMEDDIEVVARARNGEEALAIVKKSGPKSSSPTSKCRS